MSVSAKRTSRSRKDVRCKGYLRDLTVRQSRNTTPSSELFTFMEH